MTRNLVHSTVIDRECIVFARYLIQQDPNDYVIGKYREAHRTSVMFRSLKSGLFDVLLLWVSGLHPWASKLVDCYTSIFFRSSVVRKKMVLLLAILESCAPTHVYFDSLDSQNRAILFLRMLQQGFVFILMLMLGMIIFLPLQLAFSVSTKLAWLAPKTVRQGATRVPLLAPSVKPSQDRAGTADLPPDMPLTS